MLAASQGFTSVCLHTIQHLPHTHGMTGWRHRPVHYINVFSRECRKRMRCCTEMAQNRLCEHCCSAQPCGCHPQVAPLGPPGVGVGRATDGGKYSPCHSSRAHGNACREARSLRASHHAQPMQLCWVGADQLLQGQGRAHPENRTHCARESTGVQLPVGQQMAASRSDNLALRNTRVGTLARPAPTDADRE